MDIKQVVFGVTSFYSERMSEENKLLLQDFPSRLDLDEMKQVVKIY